MGAFVIFLLKWAVCLVLFYLLYSTLLKHDTFHRFNRVVLLASFLLTALLPLFSIQWLFPHPSTSMEQWVQMEEPVAVAIGEVNPSSHETALWGYFLLVAIYLTGVIVMFVRYFTSIGRISAIIRKGEVIQRKKGIRLVLHESNAVPFSWIHYIVMSRNDWEENGEVIAIHEQAHIQLRHSWDMLFVELCICLQWFNPAAWLLRRELKEIHEYEADEAVLKSGVNAKQYQLLIIKKAVGARLYSLANSFNHSNIKDRITMMLKKKSNPWARLKSTLLVPAGVAAIALFANQDVVASAISLSSNVNDVAQIWETKSVKNKETVALDNTNEEVIEADVQSSDSSEVLLNAEIMPTFVGGEAAMLKYLSDNIKYPADAALKGISGRAIVHFTITKTGKLNNFEILRSSGNESLDKEALRVVKSMPNWNPGTRRGKAIDVRFTLPVRFKLNEEHQSSDSSKVLMTAENMPTFVGGEAAMMKYLSDNIKYPEDAISKGISGRAMVQFIVTKSGKLDNFEILRSSGNESLDKEALRVMKSMPDWNPGTQRGEAVDVRFTLPVTFNLN